MPRNEAQELFDMIKPVGSCYSFGKHWFHHFLTCILALALDPKLSLEIMGSFRRFSLLALSTVILSCLFSVTTQILGERKPAVISTFSSLDRLQTARHMPVSSWLSISYIKALHFIYPLPGILRKLCNSLHKQGILTGDLALPDEWEALEATYRGLCRKDADSKHRRIGATVIDHW
jgi:hypothetical protein